MKIITFTINPALDMTTKTSRVVSEDKLRCSKPTYDPGGGGINVSRAIYKLGGESIAFFTSSGATGKLLEKQLRDEGINCTGIETGDLTRINVTVSEENSDHQYRFVMPGPSVTNDEAAKLMDVISRESKDADYVVFSGSLPSDIDDEFYAEAIKQVNKSDAKAVLDTSGEPLEYALSEKIYLLKPNFRELDKLTDTPLEDEKGMEKAARKLYDEKNIDILVVSLGQGGIFYIYEDESEHIKAPVVPIKSKVGAGDSMVAGTVLALTRDMSVRDAAIYGMAAGSAAVMTPGIELCRKEDTDRIFKHCKDECS